MKLAVAALFGLVASVLAAPVIEVGSFLFREARQLEPCLTARFGRQERDDNTVSTTPVVRGGWG